MFLRNAAQCFQKMISIAINEGEKVSPRGIPCYELLNANLVFEDITMIYLQGLDSYAQSNLLDSRITAISALLGKKYKDLKMLYHNENYDVYAYVKGNEFKKALDTLKQDKNSRQATIILGEEKCTNVISYYVRENKLYCMVHSRSIDMFNKGMTDLGFLSILQQLMANSLCIGLGTLTWNIGSLHIYECDVPKFKDLIKNHAITCIPYCEHNVMEDFILDRTTVQGIISRMLNNISSGDNLNG